MFVAVFNKKHLVLCNIRLPIKWRSKKQFKGREMTVERVVGVYPVSSRKLPQPQLQTIFGRFIRTIVRFYAF